MFPTMDSSQILTEVTIDVGGTIFRTYAETLKRYPDTTLCEVALSKGEGVRIFFDRNPWVFAPILDFYRCGKLHVPPNICPQTFRDELDFWKIGVDKLSPCCFNAFYSIDDTEERMNIIQQSTSSDKIEITTTRGKIWRFLDDPCSSIKARMWGYTYFFCLLVSFFVSCCLTTRAFRGELPVEHVEQVLSILNYTNPKFILQFTTYEYLSLRWIYYACQIIFTIEFLLRFVLCYDKKKFILCPFNIIDVLAITATLVAMVMRHYEEKFLNEDYLRVYIILYSLSGLRLLRFIRLARLFQSLKILILTVKTSSHELFLLVLTLLMFSSIFAGIQFAAELHTPDNFSNMFQAVWWSIITMTTVGYGDEYPKTPAGKVVGSLCAICGVMIMAMPVAMMAGNFSGLFTLQKNNRRHRKHIGDLRDGCCSIRKLKKSLSGSGKNG